MSFSLTELLRRLWRHVACYWHLQQLICIHAFIVFPQHQDFLFVSKSVTPVEEHRFNWWTMFLWCHIWASRGRKVQKNTSMIEVIHSNACLTLWKDFLQPRTCFPEPNQVFLSTNLKQTTTKNNRNLMKMINEEFKSSSLERESQLAPDVVFVSWYNLRATLVMMLQKQHLHEWRDDSWLAASQISYFFFSVQISRYRWRLMCQQDGLRSRCDVMMKKYVY